MALSAPPDPPLYATHKNVDFKEKLGFSHFELRSLSIQLIR